MKCSCGGAGAASPEAVRRAKPSGGWDRSSICRDYDVGVISGEVWTGKKRGVSKAFWSRISLKRSRRERNEAKAAAWRCEAAM